MPALIGATQIINVTGGVVHFGDVAVISPKSATKTFEGSGAGNVGGIVVTLNGFSVNPTIDSNLIDQPTIGNN
ncbi:spore germination protein [Bacillus sp. FJAT-49732]|uniref:Spore germination protein n=1 Tax=Lederbergia citrisecunda TaxID=2833583 RepID=A0A942TJI6_9BACI|nr:spore germination protein [Lederbergia citrisecunda]MBS4198653.1 spore germination protein [Lederbergia citrisecunda]